MRQYAVKVVYYYNSSGVLPHVLFEGKNMNAVYKSVYIFCFLYSAGLIPVFFLNLMWK